MSLELAFKCCSWATWRECGTPIKSRKGERTHAYMSVVALEWACVGSRVCALEVHVCQHPLSSTAERGRLEWFAIAPKPTSVCCCIQQSIRFVFPTPVNHIQLRNCEDMISGVLKSSHCATQYISEELRLLLFCRALVITSRSTQKMRLSAAHLQHPGP